MEKILVDGKYIKLKHMRGLLYIIAVILVIGWLFGFFFIHAGSVIHILLVIAVIAVLLGVIRRA
ncbi:lmo0937 family membrane protein [Mucilaginibacter sp.]|uniref:lmo0937 family membrane protein n=1 Tax=Mucilaginibacter sp. TaxID=1882438 RepID=UPI0035BC73A8